jgi:hypothetical protein
MNGTAVEIAPLRPRLHRPAGKARFYFRRTGFRQQPLPGLPYSPEFMAAYQAANGEQPSQPQIGSGRTVPDTINALVVTYYASTEWQHRLAEDTRKSRGRIIEKFRAEHGDKRVALLRREHIESMLVAIRTPAAQRNWLKARQATFQIWTR